ncbi:hypothetical protein [Streptomyces sp. GbtcB6]|uniref:hypothetical protein n=1 Tax=Streptomyces sp. GbtcB6 TaxID=2824751 RepID=UPI001C2FB9EE|nr:hypothetical protein [Streptomyces sp. GbtcB6]
MSDDQNAGAGQTSPPPAPAPTVPPSAQPQPSFTDTHFNPALVGTEKKNDNPALNKAVQPPGAAEER